MVRFGIIGLGTISKRFAAVLNEIEDAVLTGVAARDLDRAEEFAKTYGANKFYDNYLQLIQDNNVDVLYIALTHNLHFDIAKLCIENGKAVLCEKPFFLYREEAVYLTELASSSKVLMMEAMWTRFLPTYQKAKEWVKTGVIGELKFIDAKFASRTEYRPDSRLYDRMLAGGAMYDIGVYPIEFAMGITGEMPDVINCAAVFAKTGVDELMNISLRFPSGTVASLSCGITVNMPANAYLYGTKGHIVCYDFYGSKKCECYDEKGNRIDVFEDSCRDGFIYEIQHFIELYRSGRTQSDVMPLQDTVSCAEIFDKLREQWDYKVISGDNK